MRKIVVILLALAAAPMQLLAAERPQVQPQHRAPVAVERSTAAVETATAFPTVSADQTAGTLAADDTTFNCACRSLCRFDGNCVTGGSGCAYDEDPFVCVGCSC